MGYRVASMQEERLRKGPWLEEENERLTAIVALLGEQHWDSLAKASGLRRSGKSCRMRWMNYLRPNLKHGRITAEEEQTILQLHKQWGNKWSKIARSLPGRTDNEIKNYWRSHLRKKAQYDERTENCESPISNDKEEPFIPKCDKTGLRIDEDWIFSNNIDIWRTTSKYSSGNLELTKCAFLSSPYEARLSDWILGWTDEQSLVNHDGNCQNLDFCSSFPAWSPKDSDASIWKWDSSGSLWDTD